MDPNQEIVSAEYWQQTAERLLYSANALLEKLRTIQVYQVQETDIVTWNHNIRALLESNYMLLGFAVENSIKGYSIHKYSITHGHPTSGDFSYLMKNVWNVKNGHDLIGIAKKAELYLSEQEIELLRNLREHSLWKGRYHIPTRLNDIENSILPGEKDKYTAEDRQIVTELIQRIGVELRH